MHDGISGTERLDPGSKGIDTWPNGAILTALWQGQLRALSSVEAAIPAISAAADGVAARLLDDGSRLIYTGAGSSGLLAMQDAMEMTPTFNWPASRLVYLMAGGDQARLTPIGTVEDDAGAAERDAGKIGLNGKDVVIAVAASGTTPYTVAVLNQARLVGALCVGIANNPNTDVLKLSDHPILLDSGAEVIAGSTRMGAGTAQKAALGMLSSLVMTRLGHVVDGWMVSLVADNAKLKKRAIRMVSDITGCSVETAAAALERCEGHVKPAVLHALGADDRQIDDLLSRSNGHLRAAMTIFSGTSTSNSH